MSVADISVAIILLLNVFIPAMVWSRVVRTAALDTSDTLVVNVELFDEIFEAFVAIFVTFVAIFVTFVAMLVVFDAMLVVFVALALDTSKISAAFCDISATFVAILVVFVVVVDMFAVNVFNVEVKPIIFAFAILSSGIVKLSVSIEFVSIDTIDGNVNEYIDK